MLRGNEFSDRKDSVDIQLHLVAVPLFSKLAAANRMHM